MRHPERLHPGDSRYPPGLNRCLGLQAPDYVLAWGNLGILNCQPVALFCSVKCPGALISQTYDLAQHWRKAGLTVISGFHSPMEQECLKILLRSPHPVILCPARSLPKRVPPPWQKPLEEGRLLVLSAMPEKIRRATIDTAHQRNRFVCALADRIFVAYAEPDSKTESLCREIVGWGKPLYTHAADANQNLLRLGARPWIGESP